MALPQYRLNSNHFFAPNLLKEGTVINYDGQPTPQMEPLNEEAEDRLAEYYKKNPNAAINVVDALPDTVGDANAQVQVVSDPTPDTSPVLTIAEATTAKAKPGPTEVGGTVVDTEKKA